MEYFLEEENSVADLNSRYLRDYSNRKFDW